ncbi:MAG: ABC transporter permease, partial [bacterium]|nr:ABC transporter permease [bacterium]
MILLESVGIAFSQLWANKIRSTLTLLGMLIGVGSVVGIVSISEGMRRMVYEEFGKLGGANFIYVVPREWVNRDGRWVRLAHFEPLTMEDVELVKLASDRIDVVLPLLPMSADVRVGKSSFMAQIEGTIPAYAEAYGWKVEDGHFLLETAISANRRVA